jgi:hypothetical protein
MLFETQRRVYEEVTVASTVLLDESTAAAEKLAKEADARAARLQPAAPPAALRTDSSRPTRSFRNLRSANARARVVGRSSHCPLSIATRTWPLGVFSRQLPARSSVAS